MRFWIFASSPSFLWLGTILAVTMLLLRLKPFQKSRIPYSIIAGLIVLFLGPQLIDWLPMDTEALEFVVYHGLALTFIAIGLQAPPEGASSKNTFAMGIAMPMMAVAQGFIGLAIVVLMPLIFSESLHPGLGLLLPLGFNQGPGQALSLGEAWSANGLENGGQIGLILAAVGFGWSIVVGIPLVLWLKKHQGFATHLKDTENDRVIEDDLDSNQLSHSIALVCMVYIACYGVLSLLNGLLESKPGLQSMIWGFHYLIALIIAVGARKGYAALFRKDIDKSSLQQLANVSVDWVTCAAIAAIQLSVLSQNWLPILLLSAFGLLITLCLVLWWSSRGFTQDRSEHAIVWFGASTGTLPMGLALLRMVDPKLQSSAPSSVALGSMVSLFASIPLLLVIMPYVIDNYPEKHPSASLHTLGFLVLYFVILGVLWWRTVRFSLKKPQQLWRR